jgi:hypothetical protein
MNAASRSDVAVGSLGVLAWADREVKACMGLLGVSSAAVLPSLLPPALFFAV